MLVEMILQLLDFFRAGMCARLLERSLAPGNLILLTRGYHSAVSHKGYLSNNLENELMAENVEGNRRNIRLKKYIWKSTIVT